MSAIYVNSIKDKTNTRELASDSGSAWSWGPGVPAGTVLQVKSTTKTDTWSDTPGAGVFSDITGLSVSITPASSSNKILVTFSTIVSASALSTTGVRLVRDSTAISIGDARSPDTGPRVTSGGVGNVGTTWQSYVLSNSFLDSPSTTSSVTYKLQLTGNNSSTQYVNRTARDVNNSEADYRSTSHITVMEIVG